MSETLQYVLAGIIVALAVIAAVTSFVRAARGQKTTLTACTSCKLKDICQKPEKNSVKKCADKVAQVKNTQ
jgi:hypothetical protein